MELTYESVSTWFDGYYKTVESIGALDKISMIGKHFTDDFRFNFKTGNIFSSGKTREELLLEMIHPGIHEQIKPLYYAINLKEMVCVVYFLDQIVSDTDGNLGKEFECSCHYHFRSDKDMGIKIYQIDDWVGYQSPEDQALHLEAFTGNCKKAMENMMTEWIRKAIM